MEQKVRSEEDEEKGQECTSWSRGLGVKRMEQSIRNELAGFEDQEVNRMQQTVRSEQNWAQSQEGKERSRDSVVNRMEQGVKSEENRADSQE